jgi:zinc protease
MQIANEIAFLGSSLNSYATSDGNSITASTLKKNLEQTFDIIADCILNPTFTEDELQREVTQRLASIKQGKTDPNTLAETRFTKIVFGDMPYGDPINGTETSLNKITVSDLKAFYTNYIIPNNTYCIISGDITLSEAKALVERRLKEWNNNESRLVNKIDDFKVSSTDNVIVVNRDGAVQSAIRIGCLIPDKANPDINKLSTLNTYLGGYYRSQLFQKLREEKSYTYGVSSSIDARLFTGIFAVRTQVGSQFTEGAVEDILDEIKKLSTTPIPDDRLNEVKSYLIGSFPMQIQTNAQVADLLVFLKLYNLPMNYYDNYISSVQGTTKEDLMKIAQKYLDVSKMSIVISGDNEIIAPTLSKFGNVESVDADGQPLK